jgi:hypothetical protein
LGAEHVFVLRVVDHEEPQVRSLESVKGEIELILKKRAASKLAQQKGKELIVKLKQGESPNTAAKEYFAEITPAAEVGRDSKKTPSEILQTLFTMPRPRGQSIVYDETGLANGDYAVILLEKVIDGSGKGLKNEEISKLKAAMERMSGESGFDHLVENMRAGSNIVIPEEKK